jgi:hypothetical protein
MSAYWAVLVIVLTVALPIVAVIIQVKRES